MFTSDEIKNAVVAFTPTAIYDPETDCFEFIASNESYYAESIDALVTAYLSQATGATVGFRLKKVRKFFRELLAKSPGFRTEIEDHRIKVEHLFTAKIWDSADPRNAKVVTYRRLRQFAKEHDISTEIDDGAELVA
jgi:hypothetical protein